MYDVALSTAPCTPWKATRCYATVKQATVIGVGLSWRGTHDVLQLEHHHPIRHELRQHPASIKLQGKQALGLSSLKRILDLPQRSASSNTQS